MTLFLNLRLIIVVLFIIFAELLVLSYLLIVIFQYKATIASIATDSPASVAGLLILLFAPADIRPSIALVLSFILTADIS